MPLDLGVHVGQQNMTMDGMLDLHNNNIELYIISSLSIY